MTIWGPEKLPPQSAYEVPYLGLWFVTTDAGATVSFRKLITPDSGATFPFPNISDPNQTGPDTIIPSSQLLLEDGIGELLQEDGTSTFIIEGPQNNVLAVNAFLGSVRLRVTVTGGQAWYTLYNDGDAYNYRLANGLPTGPVPIPTVFNGVKP